jgi:NADPH:quinone reductase
MLLFLSQVIIKWSLRLPLPASTGLTASSAPGSIRHLQGPAIFSRWQIGDAVCALTISGGYAQYALAEQSLCLPVPSGFSFMEAAALPETCFTVYDNLFTRGQLKAGESVLVHGGSGGIGSTAIQMAKAKGAIVFATAGGEEKALFCKSLGADEVFLYREQDFAQELNHLTQGAGINVVLDVVGAAYLPRNLQVLAPEGRLIQIATQKGSRAEIDLRLLMQKRLTISGSTLRPRSVADKSTIADKLLQDIWPLLERNQMRPFIQAVFPLEEAAKAHILMESGAHCGKIVLSTE